MKTFLVRHALIFTNGGLVIAIHNDICDEIIHLAKQAFLPHCVLGKPLIHLGCIRSDRKVRHGGSVPETRGGVSIQGIW